MTIDMHRTLLLKESPLSCIDIYVSLLVDYLAEVGFSLLTKGQMALSLAFAAILIAHLTRGGVGLASSLRHRAISSSLRNVQAK